MDQWSFFNYNMRLHPFKILHSLYFPPPNYQQFQDHSSTVMVLACQQVCFGGTSPVSWPRASPQNVLTFSMLFSPNSTKIRSLMISRKAALAFFWDQRRLVP